jgi:hypothetical protein
MPSGPDARKAKLAASTRNQLLEMAKTMGIKRRHAMPKDRLISAISRGEKQREAVPAKTAARPREQPGIGQADMQQRTEQAKYDLGLAQPAAEFPPQGRELPERYGRDRLALLVRDPYWVHAYWEITPETFNLAEADLGAEHQGSETILRIYDLISGEPEKTFDIQLPPEANNWYINLGQPGKTFCVDIGIMTPTGRFYALARSNTITLPLAGMSDVIDEKWMSLQREFERIYALSGGFQPGASSVELQEMLEKRLKEELASGAIPSMMSPVFKKPERGFWFNVDTELIVYGATEPDATVTIQGSPLKLRPDGTFTLRFALPDGKQTIDLTARSADNKESRTITPEVEKRTRRPEPVFSE